MNEFVWYNPVKILFGKDAVEKMRPELEKVGKNILLTYGGGSIKKNGIYDRVCEVLCFANVTNDILIFWVFSHYHSLINGRSGTNK